MTQLQRDLFMRDRVAERKPRAMQVDLLTIPSRPIAMIPHNRMPDGSKLGPDLVVATRLELNLDQGRPISLLLYAIRKRGSLGVGIALRRDNRDVRTVSQIMFQATLFLG